MAADKSAEATVDADVSNIWEKVDSMVDGFFALLPNLALALVTFMIFYVVARVVRSVIMKKNTNVAKVIARLTFGGLLLAGLLVGLTIAAPSVSPADLLGTLGIGGVAIGFAFRDILQNYLAGILILVKQPFVEGDQIVFESFEGTVESIETRATFIRTYDGRRVVIPNGEIYTNAVTVNTAYDKRRNQYDIGIGYGDDIPRAREAILAAINSVEGVAEDPAPEVLVIDLAGSSVNLRARWWTNVARKDVLHSKAEVLEAVKLALDEAGVDMPYPTNVVLWHDQTEATDGDRTKQREGWPAGENPPARGNINEAMRRSQDTSEDEVAKRRNSRRSTPMSDRTAG